jgi:DNA-binding LytR/AlgR family response regulator
MKKVFVNDIVYIESWKDYIKIFLTDGKNLLAKQSISAMENLLSEHKFVRVHRSFMVSLDKISGYNGLSVQLSELEIPIGGCISSRNGKTPAGMINKNFVRSGSCPTTSTTLNEASGIFLP